MRMVSGSPSGKLFCSPNPCYIMLFLLLLHFQSAILSLSPFVLFPPPLIKLFSSLLLCSTKLALDKVVLLYIVYSPLVLPSYDSSFYLYLTSYILSLGQDNYDCDRTTMYPRTCFKMRVLTMRLTLTTSGHQNTHMHE